MMKPRTKEKLKKLLNTSFIIGTFLAVIYFAFRSGDINQIKDALLSMNLRWLMLSLLCFAVYAFCEGFVTFVFFRFQKVKTRLDTNLMVGLIGMYYSAITPAATGGQPMQVYALKKRGVPSGISSSALAVKFFCWQCAILSLGVLLWAYNPQMVRANMGDGIWFLVTGFFVNSLTVVAVVLLAISRNIVRAIIIFFVNLGVKLHMIKNKEKSASRMDAALNDFHASVELLTKHPFQFVILLLISYAEVIAMMSAIYCIYRGLGLSGASYINLFTMQLMLFIAASFTPLPGASGAQEGGFYLFFNQFFPKNILFAAMFIWRFVTYYLSILFGFLAVMIDSTRRKPAKEAEDAALPQEETP